MGLGFVKFMVGGCPVRENAIMYECFKIAYILAKTRREYVG